MMESLKQRACAELDSRREWLFGLVSKIWENPETGYCEHRTATLVKETFEGLGLPFKDGLAVTGCKAVLDTGKPGPSIALLGELDALRLPEHPCADKESGAVHVCGHHLQVASLLGAATALVKSGIADKLCGRICFITTPAEEFGVDGSRAELRESGRIEFLGGKQEMISIGVFDGIDAALLIHAGNDYHYPSSHNGFVCRRLVFKGKASHAGLSPEKGVNALYAATLAIDAINAHRESFRDEDSVRVHAIISNGGSAVNIIPERVEVEVQIRAASIEAIRDASAKVCRAAKGGAMAMGCALDIETVPGYMPLRNSEDIASLYARNVKELNPQASLKKTGHRGSSTDMGDLSCIMPILHAYSCGVEGAFHSCEFRVADLDKACMETAKLLAMTSIDMLACGCKFDTEGGTMEKEKYLKAVRSFSRKEVFDYRTS